MFITAKIRQKIDFLGLYLMKECLIRRGRTNKSPFIDLDRSGVGCLGVVVVFDCVRGRRGLVSDAWGAVALLFSG